jgi:hypothetical protein
MPRANRWTEGIADPATVQGPAEAKFDDFVMRANTGLGVGKGGARMTQKVQRGGPSRPRYRKQLVALSDWAHDESFRASISGICRQTFSSCSPTYQYRAEREK